MATSSVSGLASGLDTATIIEQLMQLEAVPQTRLKTQQTTAKSVLSTLRSINTAVSALKTQAETLAKPATWQTLAGTVAGTGVSVTVGTGAAASSFSVTVDRLAATHQLGFAQPSALTDVVVPGSGIKLTMADGTVHDIATGGGTLQELVTSINAATADTGVRATAVKVADGSYRLLAESTETGAASSFTLAAVDGSDLLGGAAVRAGADAQVSLGLGITATSATNTFTGLTPGVTLTLNPAATLGSTSTVTIARSAGSVKESVKALVDKVNSLLTTLDTQTKAGSGSTAGVLIRESSVQALRDALADTIFGGEGSMASVGLQTDRYGKLVFDETTFDKAYAEDPDAVAAQFTTGAPDGWAARVAAVAESASDPIDGTLTSAITGRQSAIDRFQDSIEGWDTRLEVRRATLQRTYTALETALSQLQGQGTWLSSQIASLPSYSSSDD